MSISFAPEDFVRGGLLSDEDVEITSAKFVAWDYNGTMPSADILACRMNLRVIGTDDDHDQYWSMGKISDFVPDPKTDGDTLASQGSKEKLTQSNFWLFMQSLVDLGAPGTYFKSGKASSLVGIQVHVERKPAPKREGLAKREGGREDMVLLPTRIIAAPWMETAKGKAKPQGKPAAAAASKTTAAPAAAAAPATAAAEPSGDVDTRATEYITNALSTGEPALGKRIKLDALRGLTNSPAAFRNAVITAIGNAEWLASNGFQYDKATDTIELAG